MSKIPKPIKAIKPADAVATDAKNLKDALKQCAVDEGVWEVDKYNLKTRAGGGFAHEIYLKKKGAIPPEDWFKNIIADVAKYVSSTPVIKHDDSNLLYEINIPDLHLSKMAWRLETGYSDYDTKKACSRFSGAVDEFIDRLGTLKPRIVFPVGNDFFNADTPENETTGGTAQDVDTRWQKSFRAGCVLLTGIIEKLSKTYTVDVIVVVGNHDTTRMWYLGEYLAAWFKSNPNVSIDNEPKLRKYYEFGKNLFMFTHGDKEKHSDLPLIMATEKPVEWGRTKYRFVHIGHLHSEITKEQFGVKTSVLPSLTPPDEWHASQGYVGNTEGAVAFLYHKEKGLRTANYYNV